MRHHHDDEPYIVIEKHSGDTGSLLLGVLIGAGIALLFAPGSGRETRQAISRRARSAGDAVKEVANPSVTTLRARWRSVARLRSRRAVTSSVASPRRRRRTTRARTSLERGGRAVGPPLP